MEYLLAAWQLIAEQLNEARHILFLSDFDGTLAPIVGRPELASLSQKTQSLLQGLARQRGFTVGVISGRALSDLKSRVSIEGIIYAGNHGMEIEGPGVTFVNPLAEEIRPFLRIMHRVLSLALRHIKGVFVEDKGLSLSVHYRQVAEPRTEEVKTIFERIVSSVQALGRVRITGGKKVYEVRPAVDWDKGKAIKLLMRRFGKGGRKSKLVPIYLGDDRTDEDGFQVIEKYGNGISVFVGEELTDTAARYFLKSPEEVDEFLSKLLEFSRKRFAWT